MSTDPKKLPRSKMLPFTFFSMPKTEFTALKPILIKKTNKQKLHTKNIFTFLL